MILRLIVLFASLLPATAFGQLAGRPGSTVPSLMTGSPNVSAQPIKARPAQRPAPQPARTAKAAPQIHPAVVRVVAPGRGSVSYGSGTLVDVKGDYGLVVTNYHVINEATGNISVVFPDGFYSLATVRKVDRDWDLAALVIKRPQTVPVPLAKVAPRPGESLTIAGYGSGNYRAVAGRCTQYVAPGKRLPFEMVELAASARQGDSGGPILNNQGELAGVLFGEGGGRTAGSYCGRVQWFLASLTELPSPSMPNVPIDAPTATTALADHSPRPRVRVSERANDEEPNYNYVARPASPFATRISDTPTAHRDRAVPQTGFVASPIRSMSDPSGEQLSWTEIAGATMADQAKTFLAILGCCAVLLHALRLVGSE